MLNLYHSVLPANVSVSTANPNPVGLFSAATAKRHHRNLGHLQSPPPPPPPPPHHNNNNNNNTIVFLMSCRLVSTINAILLDLILLVMLFAFLGVL